MRKKFNQITLFSSKSCSSSRILHNFFGGGNISKHKVLIPLYVLFFSMNEKLQIWILNSATEFDRTACIDTVMNERKENAHHVWVKHNAMCAPFTKMQHIVSMNCSVSGSSLNDCCGCANHYSIRSWSALALASSSHQPSTIHSVYYTLHQVCVRRCLFCVKIFTQ